MYNIASEIKKHRLYGDFIEIKSKLLQHQFVCWVAGGAVRDLCLNRQVQDFDLVTDASVEVLKILFPRAVLVGENFGVIKLQIGAATDFFDLASFRQESDYKDGRRPSLISSSTPYKDSERRDFTINSMFWDEERGQIIDYRSGLLDLSLRLIACVGAPDVRFNEDYLRILRLVRFAAVLEFKIETATYEAALVNTAKIKSVSGERMWAEFKKIKTQKAWLFALKLDLFKKIFINVFGVAEIENNVLEGISLDCIADDIFRMVLVVYIAKPEINFSDILKNRLKVSNYELSMYTAIRYLMSAQNIEDLEEYIYAVERADGYLQILISLVDVGLLSADLSEKVKSVLGQNQTVLIQSKDLVQLIPNRYISVELKNARKLQFKTGIKSKELYLDFLRKKYADKTEKP